MWVIEIKENTAPKGQRGRIASKLGLFFLFAKLTIIARVYMKNNAILSLPTITTHAYFLPRMSPRRFVSLIETKGRNILPRPLTKEMHLEDFLVPPAFDHTVRRLFCLHLRSLHAFL